MSVQRPSPTTDNQWATTFIDGGGGWALYTETVQSALTGILKLVMGGLTSIILIVLGTVNLQFHGWFVSISLSSILRSVAADITATVWP